MSAAPRCCGTGLARLWRWRIGCAALCGCRTSRALCMHLQQVAVAVSNSVALQTTAPRHLLPQDLPELQRILLARHGIQETVLRAFVEGTIIAEAATELARADSVRNSSRKRQGLQQIYDRSHF